jgi:hypothetical protein
MPEPVEKPQNNYGCAVPEIEDLRRLVANIIDEKTEKMIFLPKDICIFRQMRKFIAKCEKCGWPANNGLLTIRAPDELTAATDALFRHDEAWEKYDPALRCQHSPEVFPFD